MNSRYSFLKNKFHDLIIIIQNNDNIYSFGISKQLLEFIGFNNYNKYKISYLIIDNKMCVKEKVILKDNRYSFYYKRCLVFNIIIVVYNYKK